MKFADYVANKKYVVSESQSFIELGKLNEEFNFKEVLAKLRGYVAFGKAYAKLGNYEQLAIKADSNSIDATIRAKILPKKKQIAALRDSGKPGLEDKLEKIATEIDKLKNSQNTIKQQLGDALINLKDEIGEEKEALRAVPDLDAIINKKMKLADQKAKQEGFSKLEKVLNAEGKQERAEAMAEQASQAEEDTRQAEEALGEAEQEGESDQEDAEILNKLSCENEIEAIQKTGRPLAQVRGELATIYVQADKLIEGDDSDFSYNTLMLEYGLLEYPILESDSDSKTPGQVYSHIMAISDDKAEDRKGLLDTLDAATDKYIDAYTAFFEAKKALWDKVKGKTATKQVLELGGADPNAIEEVPSNEEGKKTYYTSNTLKPELKDYNLEQYSPILKANEVKQKIATAKSGGEEESDKKEVNAEEVEAINAEIEKLKDEKKSKSEELNSSKHPDVLAIELKIKLQQLKKAEAEGDDEGIKDASSAVEVARGDLKAATKEEKPEGEDSEELGDKQKEKIAKAEAGLAKAEEKGDEDKIKRYKELIDKIKSGKNLGEGEESESFWASIEEEINNINNTTNKTIMKFSDFMNMKVSKVTESKDDDILDDLEDETTDDKEKKKEDKPEDKVEDKPEASDKPEDKVEDKPEASDKPEDKPEDKVEDKPEASDKPEDKDEDKPEASDKPEDKVEDKPEDKVEDKPEASDKPEDKVEDKPEDKVEDKPEDKVEDKPEDKVEDKPEDKEEEEEEVIIKKTEEDAPASPRKIMKFEDFMANKK